MAKQPLGITVGEGGTGVYEHEDGIETFETDSPYLLTDGRSLMPPLPVHVVEGPTFVDSMGNVQAAIPVRGVTPPVDGAPINTDPPVVSGLHQIGQVLSVSQGTWVNTGGTHINIELFESI